MKGQTEGNRSKSSLKKLEKAKKGKRVELDLSTKEKNIKQYNEEFDPGSG